ncbi:GNAT family N-acetyltransferase [Streptomyces griseoloalbus]|uniref:RimJ/RimL family protein N-acetyltransferase n=1 Tax=Streptomyces griseoloalbus TaxID=67303 RepID=A0A7W8BSZ5_9ACTN|nr:GNAT family N-acetyltransferase [Streptomyces albaduncus]MBB5129067.1 RimJ/RimL family protein N-acetyltransferase [Streptomyces albaduncus]GGV61969.1 N-acetyltransferase [Streptomyces griseoloalbus]GGW50871.1 N-acetyltransferase [Streptomyces albaduncus]
MTSTFPNISISTERLVLRPLDTDDVPALAAMMNDDQVAAWTDVPQPFTEQAAHGWITEHAPAEREAGRGLDLAVTEFLTQRLVGIIQLTKTNWHVRSTELSYIIAPWARGEGYASEAALATAQWLFGDQRLERIELRTAADNTASQQVAQKIGCISEGVLRNACIAHVRTDDGGWSDIRTDFIVWSLLPEDIEGADGHLADTSGFTGYTDWN